MAIASGRNDSISLPCQQYPESESFAFAWFLQTSVAVPPAVVRIDQAKTYCPLFHIRSCIRMWQGQFISPAILQFMCLNNFKCKLWTEINSLQLVIWYVLLQKAMYKPDSISFLQQIAEWYSNCNKTYKVCSWSTTANKTILIIFWNILKCCLKFWHQLL